MTALHPAIGPFIASLLMFVVAIPGCADRVDEDQAVEVADAVAPPAAQPVAMTREEEFAGLIDALGNTGLPPEVRALAAKLLVESDPETAVAPLVAMLAAQEPLVLVAVIEALPQAAEGPATAELELLSSSHPVPEVQAAARARLEAFKAFHQ